LPVALLDRVERKQVPGELFGQEPIERKIRIDGRDHPIAIPPGFAKEKVLIQPIRIGISGQIQPMSTPRLAELSRIQKLIDQSLIGIRSLVLQKCNDLFASRRQPNELKVSSPD